MIDSYEVIAVIKKNDHKSMRKFIEEGQVDVDEPHNDVSRQAWDGWTDDCSKFGLIALCSWYCRREIRNCIRLFFIEGTK